MKDKITYKTYFLVFLESSAIFFSLVFLYKLSKIGVYHGWELMPTRIKRVNEFIRLIKEGVFPIYNMNGDHGVGLFLLGGWLGAVFNWSAETVFIIMKLGMFSVALFLFPFEVLYVWKNKIMAALSPFALLLFGYNIMFYMPSDANYGGVCAIIAFPLLLWIWENEWNKVSVLFSGIIWMTINIGNMGRSFSCFGTEIVFLIILFCKLWSLLKHKRCNVSMFVFIILTLFFSDVLCFGIPKLMLEKHIGSKVIAGGTQWHALLLGLGYIENPYGLYWSDTCAADLIKAKYGFDYITNEYLDACKKEFFLMLRTHTWFCVKGYIIKFIHSLKNFWPRLPYSMYRECLEIIALVAIFRKVKFRMDLRRMGAVFIMCIVYFIFGLVEPILAVPQYFFNLQMALILFFAYFFMFFVSVVLEKIIDDLRSYFLKVVK